MISRRRAYLRAAGVAAACLLLASNVACGKKGPPLAPLQIAPSRVEDLKVRRLGQDVYLQFTVPTTNSDGKTPADIDHMEVLALTGEPVDLAGRSLNATNLAREAKVVATIAIAPPPPPEPEDARRKREKENFERAKRGEPSLPPPAPPEDPRPKQGQKVTAVERITPAVMTPYVPRIGKPLPPPPPRKVVDDTPMPLMGTPGPPPLGRIYVAAGRSKKGRLGGLSARLAVPLQEVPPVPPQPTLMYSLDGIGVSWTAPPGVNLPIQAPPPGEPESVAVRLLFPGAIPHTYNVYAVEQAPTAEGPAAMPAPLNQTPLSVTTFTDARLQFGVERCYVVRTVEARENVTVESEPSPVACITPQDTFPPAAPRNLAAVGSEGAINLIWEPSTEADLAGYIVLRGEAGGGPLQAITPAPIRETTYRDTAVTRGVRYVYAVVAVDTSTPQNVSVESNRVEETAR